jgi:hypothetical protein
MYKLIYSCSNKTEIKSKDLRKLYKIAEFLFMNRDGVHYKLILYNKNDKVIKNWSCPCYGGSRTVLPSFEY